MAAVGSLAFDEFGRPFLILRDQDQQARLSGKDAIKVNMQSHTMRTTPGPIKAINKLSNFI